jgi:DNA-binding NtrC family response regulator
LRERSADILPLAEHFLVQQNPALRLSEEAVTKFRAYPWPGNVRELRNVVVRAAVLASGPEIGAADLPEEFASDAFRADLVQLAALPQMEKNAIASALRRSGGHQQRAATALGISKRTLQRKIKSYGLNDAAMRVGG